MADDNNIKLGLEIEKDGVVKGFDFVDERAEKSAKASAIAFEEAFQNQEQMLKESVANFAKLTENLTNKSAKESAQAFEDIFKQQAKQAKASADEALKAIYKPDAVAKSARESAEVFAQNFSKTLDGSSITARIGEGFKGLSSNLTNIAAGFYLASTAARAAASAVKMVFDAVKNGEAEFKLDKAFTSFAANAGIAANDLRQGIKGALDGFVDEGSSLKLANEAIVNLGQNASRLPEIFTLARKTYQLTGGDILSNANAIIDAVSSLNTRQLRSQNIFINAEKAIADYARQIGTLPKFLNETQKQTAILNAVLEQQNTKFKDVELSSGQAADAMTRASVAAKEAYDDISKIAALTLGDTFKSAAEGVTGLTSTFRKQVEFAALNENAIGDLTKKVEILDAKTKEYAKSLQGKGFFERAFFTQGLAEYKEQVAELERLRKKLAEVNAEAGKKVVAPIAAPSNNGVSAGNDSAVNEAIISARRDLSAKVLDIQRQQFDAERALAQKKFQLDQSDANRDLVYQYAVEAEKLRAKQQAADTEKFIEENGIKDKASQNAIKEGLERTHQANMAAIGLDFARQEDDTIVQRTLNIKSIGEAWSITMNTIKRDVFDNIKTMSQLFTQLGKTASTVFKTQINSAIFAMAQGMQTGEDAANMLFTTMLNSMAQLLIGEGTGWMLVGAARTWAGDPSGPALIGAGAAMTGFGAILASISAANGGAMGVGAAGATAGATAGGGSTSSVSSPTTTAENITPPSEGEARTPTTQVAVTINGNVLDRRETGLEIAKILEEQFSSQGLKVVGV